MRRLSKLDSFLKQSDQILRVVSGNTQHAQRPNPAKIISEKDSSEKSASLSEEQKKHIASLMRVNHTGEVCAQALYQGQGLFAKSETVKSSMGHAALEEIDHLVWCEQRIKELDNHVSYLNPIWYGLSFTLGAAAGLAGDKWSLGFVKETEDQVCKHLTEHLDQIPLEDSETRAIINQMLEDEARHAKDAEDEGANDLPSPVKKTMSLVAKLMTTSTYHI